MRDPGVHPEPGTNEPLIGPAASIVLIATLISIAGVRRAAVGAIDQEVRGNLARLEAGCDAHLTKPIDWGVLVDTCAGLIEGRRKKAA